MVVIPHNSLNLPQNMKFDNVQWEDDPEGLQKWYDGTTGVPFIDAGMRQLNAEAYMHNRLRMNTSSYLRANLLIDYRKGERWFAEKLIDWDLSNNTQGWEPSYTVFNPVVQAEKCDPDGDYIRKWVPELKDVKGKAVFAPHTRLGKAEFEKLGYPRPHVDYTESAARAKARTDVASAKTPKKRHRLSEQARRAIKGADGLRRDVATFEANVVEMTGADGKGREWEGVARQRLKRVCEKLKGWEALSAREDEAIEEGKKIVEAKKVGKGEEDLCWCCGVM
ncbi:hypothetical protein B0A48_13192 [Cryoendolithus antarcticus]|uniref:Cryptochrome/DNA photolyase FAD-binding domain-containing protein n=1 Tax=Cryoendolithus antarcticus TaxID=1507870 RepID=A0A1V8SP81_9PEZI|nr:hypothetical protein B0A48_13192 [Cryoendolithus antarcticus]